MASFIHVVLESIGELFQTSGSRAALGLGGQFCIIIHDNTFVQDNNAFDLLLRRCILVAQEAILSKMLKLK